MLLGQTKSVEVVIFPLQFHLFLMGTLLTPVVTQQLEQTQSNQLVQNVCYLAQITCLFGAICTIGRGRRTLCMSRFSATQHRVQVRYCCIMYLPYQLLNTESRTLVSAPAQCVEALALTPSYSCLPYLRMQQLNRAISIE